MEGWVRYDEGLGGQTWISGAGGGGCTYDVFKFYFHRSIWPGIVYWLWVPWTAKVANPACTATRRAAKEIAISKRSHVLWIDTIVDDTETHADIQNLYSYSSKFSDLIIYAPMAGWTWSLFIVGSFHVQNFTALSTWRKLVSSCLLLTSSRSSSSLSTFSSQWWATHSKKFRFICSSALS